MPYFVYQLTDGRPVVRREASSARPYWAPEGTSLRYIGSFHTAEEAWAILDALFPRTWERRGEGTPKAQPR